MPGFGHNQKKHCKIWDVGYTVLANATNNKISTTLNREGFRVMYCTPSYECKGLVLTYIRAVLPTSLYSFFPVHTPHLFITQ